MQDIDIWRSANLLNQQHGTNAKLQAEMRADDLSARGDIEGASTWKRIAQAVNELERQQRRHDEPLN